ncbi:MAG TPA: PLDc N-terminal domain-containing protein [Acidothermaceae bacterium]
MLVYEGFGLLLVVALWIFCLVDVIVSKEDECRNLPKLLWLLIVLMLPDVGSLLWLIAGRPRGQRQSGPGGRRQSWQQRTTHPATGPRAKMAPRPTMLSAGANPDDDDEFLRSIRRTDE